MKYVVLILVVLAVIWFLRNNRRGDPPPKSNAQPQPGTLPEPQDMVRCPVCSVHLPRADALPGPNGRLYCCAAHRQQDGA